MATRKAGASGDLETAGTRFDQWRKTRRRRAPIPEELWSVAINAAGSEGVNRTAQQLHLDAGKLKRLLVAADGRSKARHQARFVELIAPIPAATPGYVIEFESARGSKMRIHWKSRAAPDWTSLLRAWDAER
jgi:hypothetical protein